MGIMKRLQYKKQNGFTVVELLVVIVVIGVLATVTVISFRGVQQTARDKSIQSDLDALDAAETQYGAANSTGGLAWYSGTTNTNTTLGFTPTKGNVIDVVSDANDYCIRGYNPSSNKTSITNAFIKESIPGACIDLQPSVAAGGAASNMNSLLAWWKFNGNTLDATGNGFNGTPIDVTPSQGQNLDTTGAYSFNGATSQVTVASSSALALPGSFSLSAWIKPDIISTTASQGIISKDISTGVSNPPYALVDATTSGKPQISMTNSTPTTKSLDSTVGPTVNIWTFVVGTYDTSTGIMKMYVNGQLNSTSSASAQGVAAATTGLLRIGQQKTGQNRWFSGSIDDVRIYTRALSDADVATLKSIGAQ